VTRRELPNIAIASIPATPLAVRAGGVLRTRRQKKRSRSMTRSMTRRRLLLMIAALPLVSPLVSAAQQGQKPFRIGWLQLDRPGVGIGTAERNVAELRQALKARGYAEGVNMILNDRSLVGTNERATEAVVDLVRLNTDVVVVRTALEAFIAKAVTKTVPIVFVAISDPVAFKLVDSLARPGGNITGGSYIGIELNVKRLELLRQVVPNASRIGILGDRGHPLLQRTLGELRLAAPSLQFHVAEVRSPDELEDAFLTLTKAGAAALLPLQSPMFGPNRDRIVRLATKHRLASIFETAGWAEAGALMSYSPDIEEVWSRTAYFVDRILKGAKPADLPVEQSTKFRLVLNLKTAKTLGLTIPPSLLLRADQIIE
jgi:putative tryptophan/tyrosine transport system substrate-binding protein